MKYPSTSRSVRISINTSDRYEKPVTKKSTHGPLNMYKKEVERSVQRIEYLKSTFLLFSALLVILFAYNRHLSH